MNLNLEKAELAYGILQVGSPKVEQQTLPPVHLTCHDFQERCKDLRDFYMDNPPLKNYQLSEKKKTQKMFSWLRFL